MHQSWDDYYCRGFGVDPEIARERMEMLRFEQERFMFNPNDYQKQTSFNFHPLDFKCQCKRCVKMHTISHEDAKWLRSMRVVWNPPQPVSQPA